MDAQNIIQTACDNNDENWESCFCRNCKQNFKKAVTQVVCLCTDCMKKEIDSAIEILTSDANTESEGNKLEETAITDSANNKDGGTMDSAAYAEATCKFVSCTNCTYDICGICKNDYCKDHMENHHCNDGEPDRERDDKLFSSTTNVDEEQVEENNLPISNEDEYLSDADVVRPVEKIKPPSKGDKVGCYFSVGFSF